MQWSIYAAPTGLLNQKQPFILLFAQSYFALLVAICQDLETISNDSQEFNIVSLE